MVTVNFGNEMGESDQGRNREFIRQKCQILSRWEKYSINLLYIYVCVCVCVRMCVCVYVCMCVCLCVCVCWKHYSVLLFMHVECGITIILQTCEKKNYIYIFYIYLFTRVIRDDSVCVCVCVCVCLFVYIYIYVFFILFFLISC